MNPTFSFCRAPKLRRIALFAMLLVLWQIALPMAKVWASDGGQLPICTAQGLKWVDAGGNDQGGKQDAMQSMSHCPFCSGAHLVAIPPATFALDAPAALRHEPVFESAVRLYDRTAGAPPPSRAPPQIRVFLI